MNQGTAIAGRYRLERQLAVGGMGVLWLAHDTRLARKVAVKIVNADAADELKDRFEVEARAAAMVKSPHVIQVHDFGVEASSAYIVMELLEGEDLRTHLERETRLSMRRIAAILDQLGKALDTIHRAGLLHRDLKPGNIFLAHHDGREEVKIIDFGIVRTGDGHRRTRRGTVLGTPRYMSPEQLTPGAVLDQRSDLWSTAVIVYRALTGALPFGGDTLEALIVAIHEGTFVPASTRVPELPADIDGFFAQAFAIDRARRFASAGALALAFRRLTRASTDQTLRLATPFASEGRTPSTPDGDPPASLDGPTRNERTSLPSIHTRAEEPTMDAFDLVSPSVTSPFGTPSLSPGAPAPDLSVSAISAPSLSVSALSASATSVSIGSISADFGPAVAIATATRPPSPAPSPGAPLNAADRPTPVLGPIPARALTRPSAAPRPSATPTRDLDVTVRASVPDLVAATATAPDADVTRALPPASLAALLAPEDEEPPSVSGRPRDSVFLRRRTRYRHGVAVGCGMLAVAAVLSWMVRIPPLTTTTAAAAGPDLIPPTVGSPPKEEPPPAPSTTAEALILSATPAPRRPPSPARPTPSASATPPSDLKTPRWGTPAPKAPSPAGALRDPWAGDQGGKKK